MRRGILPERIDLLFVYRAYVILRCAYSNEVVYVVQEPQGNFLGVFGKPYEDAVSAEETLPSFEHAEMVGLSADDAPWRHPGVDKLAANLFPWAAKVMQMFHHHMAVSPVDGIAHHINDSDMW